MPYILKVKMEPFYGQENPPGLYEFHVYSIEEAITLATELAIRLGCQILMHESNCPEDDFCCHIVDKKGLRGVLTCRVTEGDPFTEFLRKRCSVKGFFRDLFKKEKPAENAKDETSLKA